MDSVSSADSHSSASSHSPTQPVFIPFSHKVQLPQQQRDDLVAALDKWRTDKQARRASCRSLLSKRVDLPNAQLQKLADHGADFLRAATVTPDLIYKIVQLDLASPEDLKAIASIIMDWRPDAQLAMGFTPRGGHRQKQRNTAMTPLRAIDNTSRRSAQPIIQPSFSPARMSRGHPRARGRGRGAGGQARDTATNDRDYFVATNTAAVPPRTMSTRTSYVPPPLPLVPVQPIPSSSVSQPHAVPSTSTSYMPYPAPGYMFMPNTAYYPQMYPMYTLPRYDPPTSSNQNGNK
ncbi:hypothetical protein B0H13DRAFT_1866593 [Mycena leptocephala]|nr:hypothetical protein B0H13DRAFT_1866593 [Mycena leptocephala]